jgi:hypothetical protein
MRLRLLFHMRRGSILMLQCSQDARPAIVLCLPCVGSVCVVSMHSYRMGSATPLFCTEHRACTAAPGTRCLSSTVQTLAVNAPEQGIFSGYAGTDHLWSPSSALSPFFQLVRGILIQHIRGIKIYYILILYNYINKTH